MLYTNDYFDTFVKHEVSERTHETNSFVGIQIRVLVTLCL